MAQMRQTLSRLIGYFLTISPTLAQATPRSNRRRHPVDLDHRGGCRDWWRHLVVHEPDARSEAEGRG